MYWKFIRFNIGFLNIQSSNKISESGSVVNTALRFWRQIISKWDSLWQKLHFVPWAGQYPFWWVRPQFPHGNWEPISCCLGCLKPCGLRANVCLGWCPYPALDLEDDLSTTSTSNFCESLAPSDFNWVWDTSLARQIFMAFFSETSGSRNSRPRTWSDLMPHTILSRMSSSVRTPNSQVFAFSRRSVAYRSMLSFTPWALLLKTCLS